MTDASNGQENTLDRVAGSGELSAGLYYGDKAGRNAPPTHIALIYGANAFPGSFSVYLSTTEAQQLATLLRGRQRGLIAGIEVTPNPPTPTTRTDVVALIYPIAWPGFVFMMLDHAGADRLAAQLDIMLNEFRLKTTGASDSTTV